MYKAAHLFSSQTQSFPDICYQYIIKYHKKSSCVLWLAFGCSEEEKDLGFGIIVSIYCQPDGDSSFLWREGRGGERELICPSSQRGIRTHMLSCALLCLNKASLLRRNNIICLP